LAALVEADSNLTSHRSGPGHARRYTRRGLVWHKLWAAV
jgi:hypothetical protein